MRDLSVRDFVPVNDAISKSVDALGERMTNAVTKAIKEAKLPTINPKIEVTPQSPKVEVINSHPEKGAYIITVHARDDQGRIYSMIAKPYEPI